MKTKLLYVCIIAKNSLKDDMIFINPMVTISESSVELGKAVSDVTDDHQT